ncbi:hypothetical protein BD413DRAFT_475758 [Trametes elegans]|nr:hypothetical protein BD413DRAFT_475758 [Trametes elegans]
MDDFEARLFPPTSRDLQELLQGFDASFPVNGIQHQLLHPNSTREGTKEIIAARLVCRPLDSHSPSGSCPCQNNFIYCVANTRGYAAQYCYETHREDAADNELYTMLYSKHSILPEEEGPRFYASARFLVRYESGGAQYDPFTDLDNLPPSMRTSCEAAYDRHLENVKHVFKYQHRFFLYTLLINDQYLRIARYHREGVYVTRPLDYLQDRHLLPRLVLRLSGLTDAEQGLNPEAVMLKEGSPDWDLMDELGCANPELDIPSEEGAELPPFAPPPPPAAAAAGHHHAPQSQPAAGSSRPPRRLRAPNEHRVFRHVRESFLRSLNGGWPRYRLKVGAEGKEFLIAAPALRRNDFFFDRGCLSYVGVDCQTHAFVWLKVGWRSTDECITPEGQVLEMFSGDAKMLAPTLVAHGYTSQPCSDLKGAKHPASAAPLQPTQEHATPQRSKMKTRAAAKAECQALGDKRAREDDVDAESLEPDTKRRCADDSVKPLLPTAYYCIVVKEVGLDLESFTSSWQLVKIFLDCIRTHARAYKEHGILHGDINSGNILIVPTIVNKGGREVVIWRGYLIDWECARFATNQGRAVNDGPDKVLIMTSAFCSMKAVRGQGAVITVEDELESFLYVLIDQLVRFVPSTLPDDAVAPFFEQFFGTYKVYPNNAGTNCSDAKASVILNACLRFKKCDILFCDDNGVPVHPLNGLLADLLRRFQARYAVLHFQNGDNARTLEHYRGSAPPPTVRPFRAPALKSPPGASARTLANGLKSHLAMIKVFSKYVLEPGWPLRDRVANRAPHTEQDHYVKVPWWR